MSNLKINNSQTKIVAYELKDEKFFDIVASYLWPTQRKNRKPEEYPCKQFAKGSAVYTAMLDADVLDLYYKPIYNTYKVVSMVLAKKLYVSGALFTSDNKEFMNRNWELVDHNGDKHLDSDRLTLAVQEFRKSKLIIQNLLK